MDFSTALDATSSMASQNAAFAQGAGATQNLAGARGAGRMEGAAQEFTSMFMAQMLQPLWEGLDSDELFGGGAGEQAMRSFMLKEYGKSVAQGIGGGLSAAVQAEMLHLQEAADKGKNVARIGGKSSLKEKDGVDLNDEDASLTKESDADPAVQATSSSGQGARS